jgi:hypothetical protein
VVAPERFFAYTGHMARRTKKAPATQAPGALRRIDDDFHEWRYEPKAVRRDYLAVALMSVGALALGGGVYSVFLRDDALKPIPYAHYLLAVGVVLIVAYFLFGEQPVKAVRVGELGVGFEDEGRVTRTAWYELEKVRLTDGVLRLTGAGKPLSLALRAYEPAVRRIVAEAKKRIPKRVEIDESDIQRIGAPRTSAGERVAAEPPQVTQQHCRASDKLLTFEKDARLCGRCGALYHRTEVPRRCLECGKKLKSG